MAQGRNVGTRPGDAERPQQSGAAAPGRGDRMSRPRKTAAVLRLLRGDGTGRAWGARDRDRYRPGPFNAEHPDHGALRACRT